MRIEELMTRSPVTCGPDDTLRETAQKMAGSDCGCLPVTAADGSQRLVGMITDRDICMAAQLRGRSLDELKPGLRYLRHEQHYFIFYRVEGQQVEILRILHQRTDWRRLLNA